MRELTEAQFDELIYDEEESAVVLFHRSGCGICKAVEAALERIEGALEQGIHYYAIDAEKSPVFARFGLNGVPQVLLFREGSIAAKRAGLQEETSLQEWITEVLS